MGEAKNLVSWIFFILHRNLVTLIFDFNKEGSYLITDPQL